MVKRVGTVRSFKFSKRIRFRLVFFQPVQFITRLSQVMRMCATQSGGRGFESPQDLIFFMFPNLDEIYGWGAGWFCLLNLWFFPTVRLFLFEFSLYSTKESFFPCFHLDQYFFERKAPTFGFSATSDYSRKRLTLFLMFSVREKRFSSSKSSDWLFFGS